MEWLSHQGKRDKKCDICDTPYRFRVIYDDNMPLQMPLGEIVQRVATMTGTAVFRAVSIVFFAMCIAQVPLFWKFVGRLFTYVVDGRKVSASEFTWRHVLFYGAYNTRSRAGALLLDPVAGASLVDRLETFFMNTYFPGLFQVVVFVLVLFVIFIEHEWVVREEGYTKLLLRQIGREPRTKLADLLGLMLENHPQTNHNHNNQNNQDSQGMNGNQEVNGDGAVDIDGNESVNGGNVPPAQPVADESLLNRAIEDLRQFQAHRANDSALHQAIEQNEHTQLMHNALNWQGDLATLNQAPAFDPTPIHAHEGAQGYLFPQNDNIADNMDQWIDPSVDLDDEENDPDYVEPAIGDEDEGDNVGEVEDDEDDDNNQIIDLTNQDAILPRNNERQRDIGVVENQNDDHPPQVADPPLIPPGFEDETEEELERRQNLVEDEVMAAEAANENIFELLGFRFNLVTPIQLMILADFVIIWFLFAAYLLPHTIGNMVFFMVRAPYLFVVAHYPNNLWFRWNAAAKDHLRMSIQSIPAVDRVFAVVDAVLFQPVPAAIETLLDPNRDAPPSLWERCICLAIGWFAICKLIDLYMRNLVARENPVTGTSRKIYKVLFRIVATAKVFSIFGIEIVAFPIYCGFLLDICLAPLVNREFVVPTETGVEYYFLFTALREIAFNGYSRVLFYWANGTTYMFFIALFVSMIRSKILRAGVLYFIKSPEDPNARLIHDAIVKPFKLQILRIFLSAKVYLTLILGGIGAVTWALRFLVNSPMSADENGANGGAFLPIQLPGFWGLVTIVVTIPSIIIDRELFYGPCQRYWTMCFSILCHKLRLSHFILDRPVPQERGYVVYRNLLYSFLQVGVPDYTKPVSYNEAQQIFRNDSSILACFVPDGSYVRAPSSDDNSRAFLKLAFIRVTKSDHPIDVKTDENMKNGNITGNKEDDEDVDWWDSDITYEDSYAVVYSPPNLRLRCFYLVFGVCLFAAILIVSVLLVAAALGTGIHLTIYKAIAMSAIPITQHDFRYVTLGSILIGVRVLMFIVALYERRPTLQDARNGIAALAGPARIVRAELLEVRRFAFWVFLIFILDFCISMAIHHFLQQIEQHYFGLSPSSLNIGKEKSFDDFLLKVTWPGLLLHSAASPGTFVPLWHMRSRAFSILEGKWPIAQLASFCLVMVPPLVQMFCPLPDKNALELLVLVTVLVVSVRVGTHLRAKLRNISEQIKKEKYVRGTAVENIPAEEENDQ